MLKNTITLDIASAWFLIVNVLWISSGLTVTLWPLFANPIDAASPTMPAPTIKISKLGIFKTWAIV